MTLYFGESWCAMTDVGLKIPTPIGKECAWCKEGFVEGEPGMALPTGFFEGSAPPPEDLVFYHKNCFLRTVIGSVGHQRKQCSCFGGTLEDPQGLSLRDAANASVREYEEGVRRR